MKYSAAAIVFENAVSLWVFSCWPLNGDNMLSEASMMTAIRRPGYETCRADNEECGSARARQKNGSPARNSRNGVWRTNASGDRSANIPRGNTAGNAMAVRPGSLPRSNRTAFTARVRTPHAVTAVPRQAAVTAYAARQQA